MINNELPRERLILNGPRTLSNSELIAILLEKGAKGNSVFQISKKLAETYSLKELSELGINSLSKIHGIGSAKACRISAAFELGKRLSLTPELSTEITCAEDVYNLMKNLKYENQENFVVLFLDTRKKLIRKKILFIGTLDSTIVHPREIFNYAVKESSSSIILVHNHPSGDPMPSQEDILITKQIRKAGDIIGIPVLDHVIIGNNKFISLKDLKEI
jgi:DNA repair protein RadC